MKKRFLIIHLFSNGDCLYATAIARQLKRDFPGCHITWAIAPFCASILNNNPYVDEIWPVSYIKDRTIETFRANRKRLFDEAEQKGFDKIFFTQILEENFSFYNGLVRSSIFAAFQRRITVPVDPVLELTEEEKNKVRQFVEKHNLKTGDFVILFECAPQSGQLAMDIQQATHLSNRLAKEDQSIRIILSSATPLSEENYSIIDGSVLTLRETAFLTHYCNLLIGCSSGITWSGTSTAAKNIPSIQLLNKNAYLFNSPTLDHLRVGLPIDRWLELTEFDEEKLLNCVITVKTKGFDSAKQQFGEKPVQTFKLYRGITHSFLAKAELSLLRKFILRNIKLYGFNLSMLKSILLGIVLFPVQLIVNATAKKN
jgi:ADP-heptose:LPS heptosyltransferase